MRLKLFVSWSQKRSQAVGKALAEWLPLVLPTIDPWMSAEDIPGGRPWFESIGNNLLRCRFSVVCITPENAESAWLAFEAGVVLGATRNKAPVWPLFLGAPHLYGPLEGLQGSDTTKRGLRKLVLSLNSALGHAGERQKVIEERFDTCWSRLRQEIQKIESMPLDSFVIPTVLKAFSNRQEEFSTPVRFNTVHFEKGFESHALYETVSTIAKKRLLISGRKNRKLFDKEHLDFFESLPARISKGFDFRCLFLNPSAESHIIALAHQDTDFIDQLRTSIGAAVAVLKKVGLDPDRHCRVYSTQRTFRGLVIDDAVLHTYIRYQGVEKPLPFTKSSFSVDSVGSHFGRDFMDEFSCLWTTGLPISRVLSGRKKQPVQTIC